MQKKLKDLIEKILEPISCDIFFPAHGTKEILESVKNAFKVENKFWEVNEEMQAENAFSLEIFPTYSKEKIFINIAIEDEKLSISLSVNDQIKIEGPEIFIRELFKDAAKFHTAFWEAIDKAIDVAFLTEAEVQAERRAKVMNFSNSMPWFG